ncbi:hypothetical protein BHM03_00029709, partial [Ensete ventricosum]
MHVRVFRVLFIFCTKVGNFDLYRPIRAVHTGPPGYRYADHPLPGGTTKIDRRRSIKREKGKKKKKKKKKKRKKRKKKKRRRRKKKTSIPHAILARTSSLPACRPRAILAHGRFFSRVGRRNEKDRGNVVSM